ncbi:MAG: HD domain-containing protein [gamma proteobacterium symbiont of Bathyaustriella thionipta]|nr:HD domain-containing protein [gamma proteobacterium symbiont of Bathyaustriella thionipta]MCU7950947.1 HD domain-containing protein [gamma proteobacterium symbiont of Bathyaustriella thionipta]MCU7954397.1 HD domain-containing protein [gamma proteobacterium symbiont of Bathyaustriella thionipta]MCU7957436.1 HD domain-containing protein [gamma proteobacterium symbiont of Bathyaustriella thionipta]MCU7967272.1 HD domain-containing protein [gamma proteobacterium symbiont of Bathyaustriella thio
MDKTREYKKLQDEKVENYKQTVYSIVSMIEDRDAYTGDHSQRVAGYSILIAMAMGFSDSDNQRLYQAAILHDLGKITTPDSILLNPGKLNSLEYKLIQEHVIESHNLLKKIPMFNDLAEIVLEHHERHDGMGYPHGKKGDEILPLARIMIVADAFDAMTTNRVYKGRKSLEEALHEIKTLSGKQFHPDVVDNAIEVLKNIELQNDTSQLPITELEKERFSYFFKDVISSTYNKNYLDIILTRNSFNQEYCCIHIIYLHNFSSYNNRYGWSKGDKLLREFADILKENNPDSLIFRVHGDDFILLDKQQIKLNTNLISSLDLLNKAKISVSFRHHNLNEEKIENMNAMDRHLLSPIAEMQIED